MNKREFIMQFVLNRSMAGNVSTDGTFWVEQAEVAWNAIDKVALSQSPLYENWINRAPTSAGAVSDDTGGISHNV